MNDEERKKVLSDMKKRIKEAEAEKVNSVRTLPSITENVEAVNIMLDDIIEVIESTTKETDNYGFYSSFPIETINNYFSVYGIEAEIPVVANPSIKEKGKIANYINAISNSCLEIRKDRRVVWGFRNKKGSSVIKAKIYTDKPEIKKVNKGD